jgi:BirA family biotin operon repressor/biotin-[acetyl-CoA-carboxylase] ligase
MKKKEFREKTLVIASNLVTGLVKKVRVFDTVSSTNTKAKEFARKGEPHGTVLISRAQKKGRGRFDRVWNSPTGGIYFSIILRPDSFTFNEATLMPLWSAVAVSDSLFSYGLHPAIKWPNDVRVNEKKIAGILIESEGMENRLSWVILGIGVNLNTDLNQFPSDLEPKITSVSNELGVMVDYHVFLKQLFYQLDTQYQLYINKDYDTILREWKRYSDTIGRTVRIVTSSGEILGKAWDIDRSGFLVVKTGSGEYKKITTGDCIYLDEL